MNYKIVHKNLTLDKSIIFNLDAIESCISKNDRILKWAIVHVSDDKFVVEAVTLEKNGHSDKEKEKIHDQTKS